MAGETQRRTAMGTAGLVLGATSFVPWYLAVSLGPLLPRWHPDPAVRRFRAGVAIVAGLWTTLPLLLWLGVEVRSRWRPGVDFARSSARKGALALVVSAFLAAPFAPSSMHGPRWSETAKGDLRSVLGAEDQYANVTGAYAPLECLVRPADCPPAPEGLAPLLPAGFVTEERRHGHQFAFHPGPPATPRPTQPTRALSSWAYVARPMHPDIGPMAFCADASGVVCALDHAAMPESLPGACPKECRPQ